MAKNDKKKHRDGYAAKQSSEHGEIEARYGQAVAAPETVRKEWWLEEDQRLDFTQVGHVFAVDSSQRGTSQLGNLSGHEAVRKAAVLIEEPDERNECESGVNIQICRQNRPG